MSLIDVDCPKDIFLQLISWTPHALVSPTFKEKKNKLKTLSRKKKHFILVELFLHTCTYVYWRKDLIHWRVWQFFSLFLIKTNRFHVAVCLFSNITEGVKIWWEHQRHTRLWAGYGLVCLSLLFLPHFDVIYNLLLNRRTGTRNLLQWF